MMIQDHGAALPSFASSKNESMGYDDVQRIWGDEIERRIEESIDAAGLMGEICRYTMKSGGKRVRAILPVWVCTNLGGRPDSALDLGARSRRGPTRRRSSASVNTASSWGCSFRCRTITWTS
jgi:hypothetical protein